MDTDVKKREGVDKKLPDGWKWVKLGDVCNLVNGDAYKPEDWSDEGIRIIRIQNLNDSLKPFNYWSGSLENRVIIDSGDVLLAWSGTPGTSFGTHLWRRGKAVLNQHIFRVDLNLEVIFPEWSVIAINYKLNKLIELAHGGVGLRHVKKGEIQNLEIPLPPLAEQKRIAAILNEQMEAVDKARKATEAQLDAAKQLPAAYLRAVFNSPEAQKWERKKLREICTGDGQYGTSELATSENIGLPILRMGNLSEGKITWNNLKYIQLPNSDEEKYKLQKGDIIFNRTNSAELVGKTAVFDDSRDAVFASYLIRFKVIETIANPNYVSVYINSSHGRRFIEANMARAIGQVNISASTMHKMPIPLPALNQQEKISQTLSNKMQSIDKLRCSLESQLEAINQLPAAIMRQAFNGKL